MARREAWPATFAIKFGEILCYDHEYSPRIRDFALPELGRFPHTFGQSGLGRAARRLDEPVAPRVVGRDGPAAWLAPGGRTARPGEPGRGAGVGAAAEPAADAQRLVRPIADDQPAEPGPDRNHGVAGRCRNSRVTRRWVGCHGVRPKCGGRFPCARLRISDHRVAHPLDAIQLGAGFRTLRSRRSCRRNCRDNRKQ